MEEDLKGKVESETVHWTLTCGGQSREMSLQRHREAMRSAGKAPMHTSRPGSQSLCVPPDLGEGSSRRGRGSSQDGALSRVTQHTAWHCDWHGKRKAEGLLQITEVKAMEN